MELGIKKNILNIQHNEKHKIYSFFGIKVKIKHNSPIKDYGKNNIIKIDGITYKTYETYNKLPKSCNIRIFGDNNTIVIGKNLKCVNLNISIGISHLSQNNNSTIEIGNNCILDVVNIDLIGTSNSVKIQDNVEVKQLYARLMNESSFNIGENSLLSWGVQIIPNDGHHIFDLSTKKCINTDANCVSIGQNCWIGSDVKLIKNATLGKDSVVGANSLINKVFNEENVIIAGNPGKIVKSNIYWEK